MDTFFTSHQLETTIASMSGHDFDAFEDFLKTDTSAPASSQQPDIDLFGSDEVLVDESLLSVEDRAALSHAEERTGVPISRKPESTDDFFAAALSFDSPPPVDTHTPSIDTSFYGPPGDYAAPVQHFEQPAPRSVPFDAFDMSSATLDSQSFFTNLDQSSLCEMFINPHDLVTAVPQPLPMPFCGEQQEVIASGTVQVSFCPPSFPFSLADFDTHPACQPPPSYVATGEPTTISPTDYARLCSDDSGRMHMELAEVNRQGVVISCEEVAQQPVPALGFSSPAGTSGSSSDDDSSYSDDDEGERRDSSKLGFLGTHPSDRKMHGKRPLRDYASFNGKLKHWECCGDYPNGRHCRKEEFINSSTFHTARTWIPAYCQQLARECDFCHRMQCVSCHYQRQDLEFEHDNPSYPTVVTGIKNAKFACNWCHSAKGGNLDKHPILEGESFRTDNPWGAKDVGKRAQMRQQGKVPRGDIPKVAKNGAKVGKAKVGGVAAAATTRIRKRARLAL